MATTRTLIGTSLKIADTTTSTPVPTLSTHGLSLKDLVGIRYAVSADVGATLSGTGTLEHYIQDNNMGFIQASGTITFSGLPAAGGTVTVNGVVFTAVSGVQSAKGEFRTVTDATTVGDNFVTAFNTYGDPALVGLSATNVAGVVTIAAIEGGRWDGEAGNAVTLAESATNTAVSGATLSGGAVRWLFIPELTINIATLTIGTVRAIGIADYVLSAARFGRLEVRANTVATSAGGITVHMFGYTKAGAYL